MDKQENKLGFTAFAAKKGRSIALSLFKWEVGEIFQ